MQSIRGRARGLSVRRDDSVVLCGRASSPRSVAQPAGHGGRQRSHGGAADRYAGALRRRVGVTRASGGPRAACGHAVRSGGGHRWLNAHVGRPFFRDKASGRLLRRVEVLAHYASAPLVLVPLQLAVLPWTYRFASVPQTLLMIAALHVALLMLTLMLGVSMVSALTYETIELSRFGALGVTYAAATAHLGSAVVLLIGVPMFAASWRGGSRARRRPKSSSCEPVKENLGKVRATFYGVRVSPCPRDAPPPRTCVRQLQPARERRRDRGRGVPAPCTLAPSLSPSPPDPSLFNSSSHNARPRRSSGRGPQQHPPETSPLVATRDYGLQGRPARSRCALLS